MKDIPLIRGRYYIAAAVAEGEHDRQDFKFQISDARKIARSISAFANARGGCLLIGVKDNGTIAGVRNEEDVYVVEQAAERYCDPPQHVEFTAFKVDPGVVVIRAEVAQAAERPVRASEPDGRWRAYYRVADENIVAHRLMVRTWQQRQASSGAAFSLGGHASELLALLDRRGPMTERDIAVALSLSQRSTDALIVRLASVGVVEFRYCAPAFLIGRPEP